MAIVATGVDHDNLVFKAKKLTVGPGVGQLPAAKYFGGNSSNSNVYAYRWYNVKSLKYFLQSQHRQLTDEIM